MTIQTTMLILKKQFFNKWGRFLLASGGIVIGIWAITLTTSLSLGLQSSIITAINSQPAAKSFTISKDQNGRTGFQEFSDAPKFVAMGQSEISKIYDLNGSIKDLQPSAVAANNFLNLGLKHTNVNKSCFELKKTETINNKLQLPAGDVTTSDLPLPASSEYATNCIELSFADFVFNNIYESNKKIWFGKTEKLAQNEIAVCFNCNELGKKLGASKPEDLLGKEITLDYLNAPLNFKPGQTYDVYNSSFGVKQLENSKQIKLKIASVINDDPNSFGGPGAKIYIDKFHYDEGIKLGEPTLKNEDIGYFQLDAYIDSFNNLDGVLKSIRDAKYFPLSIIEGVIAGVYVFFVILTSVLSSLGIIAIIASVFGIINVMTISVLERQKEIGVLKSLGAKDGDIFKIFLTESASLGFIGWIFGTLFAVGTGLGLTGIANLFISSNPSWKENLEAIGISYFGPVYPWWLLVGALGIALLSTILSGLIPAIKASRQNPIDVLRSE